MKDNSEGVLTRLLTSLRLDSGADRQLKRCRNGWRWRRLTLLATGAGLLSFLLPGATDAFASPRDAELEQNFLHPPESARPWVYWFWLNGNITSNGITADLEAMKRVGIGGVLIMEVDQGAPKGDADFGSPRWRELFKHVCAEAHRLGLEVNMNNDAGWCGSGGPWITPELAMQKVVWSETNVTGPCHFEAKLEAPKSVARYYQDITVLAFPTPADGARIEHLEGKAAFIPEQLPVTGTFASVPAEQTVPRGRIVELRSRRSTEGSVSWDVPAGKWTLLRLGHTPTGADNHPAPEPGRGLESDKLSKAATEAMFNGLMAKLIADCRPLGKNTLVSTHIDSWETGSQNWSPTFREDFKRLRGYDPLPFLPVMTGRVVDSMEVSERFLWDVRRTVSDLLIANYAGHMRELARRKGLRLSIEAYDGNPCDDMTYAGQADEPMAEFWSWGNTTAYSCVEMSSAAHVYGKRILGAEAFTATDGEKWLLSPGAIKRLGDWAFCEGINRFVFHRYALQPWLGVRPGMSMGPWGLHYERTETWWEQSGAWHEYLARCQYLLRQGVFVADICFLEPEGSPRRFTPTMPWRTGNTPDRPRYNFDGCSPEVVLERMSVKGGRLVLPDGMSYRVLVLPQVETMTPSLLRKVGQLVRAGATVIGPPPSKSPSLANYPGCDAEVGRLAGELWRDTAEAGVSAKGQSRVIWEGSFATPGPGPGGKSPLQAAKWIWHKEGNPAVSAPVGPRYFRRVIQVTDKVVKARMVLTADNSFELWVNGQSAGTGDDFNRTYALDVARFLRPGTNLLAVTAVNGADYPNPAGLIGALSLEYAGGHTAEIDTDSDWQSAVQAPSNWPSESGSEGSWGQALAMGPLGMQPWGDLDKQAVTPYVFPRFEAIAGMLKGMGVDPDFEADPNLRFIHRRDGDCDIYFVANSQTNWLHASCVFRVAGKAPEIWDPMSGQIKTVAVYAEQNSRTIVPLAFEPAGSKFVLFRGPAHSPKGDEGAAPITLIRRDQHSVLPAPGRSIAEPPAFEVTVGRNGKTSVLAWEAGDYQANSRSGTVRHFHVAPLPGAFELAGPWQVSFERGGGAPGQVTVSTLFDWSRHSDEGIKYFSGTATYRTAFTMRPEMLAGKLRQFLDLGEVAVIADVKLNGRELGTLWKAPYRISVGDALAARNVLEVKVANLWVNRQIGDEYLPEDSNRNADGTLKEWPAWLLHNQPSPTGRHSFTSWRLWKKDSALQPSGLLGPVTIKLAREVELP